LKFVLLTLCYWGFAVFCYRGSILFILSFMVAGVWHYCLWPRLPIHADEMPVYMTVPATVGQDGSIRVAECVTHLGRWMTLNRLSWRTEERGQT